MRKTSRFPSVSKLSFHLSFLVVALASAPAIAAQTGTDASGQSGQAAPADSDATTLEAVKVFGTLDNNLSVGSKTGQSLRETPKSITVVTSERLEAQNLTTLKDALVQTTGVTLAAYSPVDTFYFSRGFRVRTLQLDGGAPAYTGGFGMFLTPDMASYDHIEMLRGVDGMYTGAGDPGGVINMVRKRPQDTNQVRFNVSGGSWGSFRTEIDVAGPLTDDGRLRGRAVAAFEDKGYFTDRYETEKHIAYGVLEYDLTDSTLVTLGGSYESRDEKGYMGWAGVMRYSDGTDLNLPRSTAFTPDWNRWNFDTKEIFAKVDQKYGDNGVIKLNLTRLNQESFSKTMTVSGAIDPVTLTGATAYASNNIYDSFQNLADLSANGTFQLFGREHRYTVGMDYAKVDGGGQSLYTMLGYENGIPVDVFNFDPALYPEPDTLLNARYLENSQAQNGFYATLGLQLADPLRLTIGGRYGRYRYSSVYQPYAVDGTPVLASLRATRYNDSKFIPSAALSYEVAANWTAYLSYAETFKVQSDMLKAPLPGTPLDPVTGDSIELGIKGEVGGFLNTSAAIYRVTRAGQGTRDPAYPVTPGSNGSSCCYIEGADITSEGFDAEISGVILPGWQLFAGYTYNKIEYTGDPGGIYSSGAYFINMTPRNLLKVWSTWQLPGNLSNWTLNAGVVAQGDSYVSGSVIDSGGAYIDYNFTQAGYAIWNASLNYRINDAWTVGLYADNLTDKRYYSSLGSIWYENNYGTPRSYVLTLRGNW